MVSITSTTPALTGWFLDGDDGNDDEANCDEPDAKSANNGRVGRHHRRWDSWTRSISPPRCVLRYVKIIFIVLLLELGS